MNKHTQAMSIKHHHIVLESETHSLYIVDRNRRIRLTQTEYRIFQALFQEGLLSDAQLASEVFECVADKNARECLEKHIDHIRGKIRMYGWGVYRVLQYGYILLQQGSY